MVEIQEELDKDWCNAVNIENGSVSLFSYKHSKHTHAREKRMKHVAIALTALSNCNKILRHLAIFLYSGDGIKKVTNIFCNSKAAGSFKINNSLLQLTCFKQQEFDVKSFWQVST